MENFVDNEAVDSKNSKDEDDMDLEDDYDMEDGFIVDTPEEDKLDLQQGLSRKRPLPIFGDEMSDPLMRPRKRLKLLAKKTEEENSGFIVGQEEDLDEQDDFIVGDSKNKADETVDAVFGYSMPELIELDKKNDDARDEEDEDVMDLDDEDPLEKLKKLFPEEELKEKYLTLDDQKMAVTDAPERLQEMKIYREETVTEEELELEARWILKRMSPIKLTEMRKVIGLQTDEDDEEEKDKENEMDIDNVFDDESWTLEGKKGGEEEKKMDESQLVDLLGKELVGTELYKKEAIKWVLRQVLEEKNDVPYLAQYHKDHYMPHLEEGDLWDVVDLDREYFGLTRKRKAMLEMVSGMDVKSSYEEHLRDALTIEEIEDFREWLRHFHSERREPKKKKPRKIFRKKRDLFQFAKSKQEYAPLMKMFGLSSTEFAENIHEGMAVNTVNDWNQPPLVAAKEYSCEEMPDPKGVLRALRSIFVFDITREPLVRKKVRGLYDCCSRISTRATERGLMDNSSEFAAIKSFASVPLYVFEEESESQAEKLENLLRAFEAEREGKLEITFEPIDDYDWKRVLGYDNFFLSDKYNLTAQQWNQERLKVIAEVKNVLHKSMTGYLRAKLRRKAMKVVGKSAHLKLHNLLKRSPYRKKIDEADVVVTGAEEILEKLCKHRVISCLPAADFKEETIFTMLDENGSVLDTLRWMYTHRGVPKNESDVYEPSFEVLKQENEFVNFIMKHKPDVVCVVVNNLACKKTAAVVNHCLMRVAQKLGVEDPPCELFFIQDTHAKLYARSQTGQRDLPEFDERSRICISCGRELNDPLTEISRLTQDGSILCLKMHPLQHLLPKETLAFWFRRAFVRVVNAVGIDFNRILAHKHLRTTLRFVSGLGPRKAKVILESVGGDAVYRRADFLDVVEKNVYRNMVGFLKICTPNNSEIDEAEFFRLDRTRIHPEDYYLARKMCTDALEAPTPEDNEVEQQEKYVEEIMNNPGILEELDLEAYAIMLEDRENLMKRTVLLQCKDELTHPFAEVRDELIRMDDVSLFYAQVGCTYNEFAEGHYVDAEVIRVMRDLLLVRLENGLFGKVDGRNVTDMRSIRVGQRISGKVVYIERKEMRVELDCREEVMESYLQRQSSFQIQRRVVHRKKKKSRKERVARNINHPNYKNVDFNQAAEFLKDKPVGECVIRPSYSKGMNYLCFTFKFHEDVCLNLTIEEKDKPNAATLGKTLVYNRGRTNMTFSELDEIYVTLVQDFLDYGEQVINHSKYINFKNKKDIHRELRTLKSQNPSIIPYRMVIDRKDPGCFYIYYIPGRQSVIREKFRITPEGYKLEGDPNEVVLKDVEKVLDRFKRTYKNLDGYLEYKRKRTRDMPHRDQDVIMRD